MTKDIKNKKVINELRSFFQGKSKSEIDNAIQIARRNDKSSIPAEEYLKQIEK